MKIFLRRKTWSYQRTCKRNNPYKGIAFSNINTIFKLLLRERIHHLLRDVLINIALKGSMGKNLRVEPPVMVTASWLVKDPKTYKDLTLQRQADSHCEMSSFTLPQKIPWENIYCLTNFRV